MSRAAACRGVLFLVAVTLAGAARPTVAVTIVRCTYTAKTPTSINCSGGGCPASVSFPSTISGSFTYQVMPANPRGSGIFNYTNFTQAVEQHATDYTLDGLLKVAAPGTAGSPFTIDYVSSTQQFILQANVSASSDGVLPATQVTITLPCSQICANSLPTTCSKLGPDGTISIIPLSGTPFTISGDITLTQEVGFLQDEDQDYGKDPDGHAPRHGLHGPSSARSTDVKFSYIGNNINCSGAGCPKNVDFPTKISGSFTYQVMPANAGAGNFGYTNLKQGDWKHATEYTLDGLSKPAVAPGTVGSLFTIHHISGAKQIFLQANLSETADLPPTEVTITLPCDEDCSKILPASCTSFGKKGTISIKPLTGSPFEIKGDITLQ